MSSWQRCFLLWALWSMVALIHTFPKLWSETEHLSCRETWRDWEFHLSQDEWTQKESDAEQRFCEAAVPDLSQTLPLVWEHSAGWVESEGGAHPRRNLCKTSCWNTPKICNFAKTSFHEKSRGTLCYGWWQVRFHQRTTKQKVNNESSISHQNATNWTSLACTCVCVSLNSYARIKPLSSIRFPEGAKYYVVLAWSQLFAVKSNTRTPFIIQHLQRKFSSDALSVSGDISREPDRKKPVLSPRWRVRLVRHDKPPSTAGKTACLSGN